MVVETQSAHGGDRLQVADRVHALAEIALRACGFLAGALDELQEPFSPGLGVMLRDRPDETLDLLLDAVDLFVEELELVACCLALSDLGAQPLPDVTVGGAGRQPFGPLGNPLLARLALERVLECREDGPQRLQRVELLAHLLYGRVDVAVGLDRLAQLADPDRILLQDEPSHEFGRRLVLVQGHRVHDRLLQGGRVLLAIRQVREQVTHVFPYVVAGPVAMIDEIVRPERRDEPRAHVVPLRRDSGGPAAPR